VINNDKIFYIFILQTLFEFKFQKWFDYILGSIEILMDFRMFELLNLIQISE
jgi:hypothetical protein